MIDRGAGPMTPERWRRIDSVLQAVLDVDRSDRHLVIDRECRGDDALRREVVSLLDDDANAHGFLEHAPVATLGDVRPVADRLARALAQVAQRDASLVRLAEPPSSAGAGTLDAAASKPTRSSDPSTTGRRARMVSARSAMYVSVLMLVVGLVGGWSLPRLLAALRLPKQAANVVLPAISAMRYPALESGAAILQVVDRSGRPVRTIPATRPWTPRISPDGHRVVFGAFGNGRTTSDLWMADLDGGTARRLTDDIGDSNDPQWSRDGTRIAFSVNAPEGKDIFTLDLTRGTSHRMLTRPSLQFPGDWTAEGSLLVVSEEPDGHRRDILVQRPDWSLVTPFAASAADEFGPRVSPDGKWIAWTSDVSGEPMVYLDAFASPGRPVAVSRGEGQHPVWRGDGAELYYWSRGTLIAATLAAGAPGTAPIVRAHAPLFSMPYADGPNTMYDVTPDGSRFVIVRRP